jgi:hypothetical protein
MWDLWWTKWCWDRFSPSTSVSPANLHSTNFSTITITYPGLVQQASSGRSTKSPNPLIIIIIIIKKQFPHKAPYYVGVLISFWLFLFSIFLFAAQPKELFLVGLKKLEQRSHKCVELRGEYVE